MTADAPKPGLTRLPADAQLAALPESAIRLLELSQDAENGPAEFAEPVEPAPGLTSHVRRFVNTSYFGLSREIPNVKLVISLVGCRAVANFALGRSLVEADGRSGREIA